MNESCVFVGPTRVPKKAYPRIDFFPPAALGSVYRAFQQGYRRIGIIDGFFGNTPSVWHKEIMFVIAHTLNPDYAEVLLNTTTGRFMLGVAGALQILGLFAIKKITTVKV